MYSLLEENELIHQAQSGSQTACAKMLTAYEGLLKKMSRRYEYTPAGKIIAEDALSILYLAFMEAVRDFNPAHGTPFAAFLQSRLHGSIYKAFRQACRDSQRLTLPASTDEDSSADYFDRCVSQQPEPERQIIAKEELSGLIRCLDKEEKQLLQLLYIQNLPQTAVARYLHITPQAVSKRKQHLTAKLKKLA